MKKNILVTLIALLSISGLFVSSPHSAEEEAPAALTILKKTKELLEPTRPSIRKVVMTLRKEGDPTVERIMGQAYKGPSNQNKMLLVMLEPSHFRGFGYLLLERDNQVDEMYIYIPPLRRVKKFIGPVEQYTPFYNTDYTYEDIGFLELHGKYRVVGQEEYEGVTAYKIEQKMPQNQYSYYSKVVYWIAKNSFFPIKREFFDPSGRLWKVELFDDIKVVEGMPSAMRRTMKDVLVGTSTELDMQSLQYCGTLDEDLFDPKNIANVSANPIWQPYCTIQDD